MDEGTKIAAIVAVTLLLITGAAFASCNYQAAIDSRAPVVETCIKHPATRPPFRGMSQ